jgi:hypothetical protein
MVDLDRAQLLDVPVVRRIRAVALVVDESSEVAAGEILVREQLPLDRLGHEDAVHGVRERCEIGAAGIELQCADAARRNGCGVEERAEPRARGRVEVAAEQEPAALRLVVHRGGVPLRAAVGGVDEKVDEQRVVLLQHRRPPAGFVGVPPLIAEIGAERGGRRRGERAQRSGGKCCEEHAKVLHRNSPGQVMRARVALGDTALLGLDACAAISACDGIV